MRAVIPAALLMCGVLAAALSAAEDHAGWTTDFAKAKAEAKASNKPILALFTGSDWCPPCMALEKKVFASEEFKTWAKDNLVLLFLDYPNSKEQDAKTKEQNAKLAKQYSVQSFPTLVFLDASGKEKFRTSGYRGEDAKKWIANTKESLHGK